MLEIYVDCGTYLRDVCELQRLIGDERPAVAALNVSSLNIQHLSETQCN